MENECRMEGAPEAGWRPSQSWMDGPASSPALATPAPEPGTHPTKRGMVYSISIFLMLAALVALSALWLSAADRREQTLGSASDIEVLDLRLMELKWITLQQLGLRASLTHNGTTRWFEVSDAGFPLTNSANGRANINGLGPWLEANWTNVTHANLSYDASGPYEDGVLLRTTSGITYTQDNSNSGYDSTYLYVGSLTPQYINVSIACTAPAGADNITYIWNSPIGTGTFRALHFTSTGAVNDSHDDDTGEFWKGTSKTFSALYWDGSDNWMQTLHADWIAAGSYFRIWGEISDSYPGMSKGKVNCTWIESVMAEDTGAAPDDLWVPASVNLTYGAANYSGQLVLARG